MGDLHLDVYHNSIWIEDVMTPISGDQGDQWHEHVVDLSAFDGEIISLESPLHFINGGLKPGIGFYILPDLFIGGYFQYNFFNEYYPFEYNTDEIHAFTYSPNAYRITLKYVFMKKADLDISYWNNELYIGANAYFYSYNLFIGYGVLENRFYIKLNSIDLL
jgi:hypothetical protein